MLRILAFILVFLFPSCNIAEASESPVCPKEVSRPTQSFEMSSQDILELLRRIDKKVNGIKMKLDNHLEGHGEL